MTAASTSSEGVGTSQTRGGGLRASRTSLYIIAILFPVATLWVSRHLPALLGSSPLLMLFLVPITLTAYLGGVGPGLVCTALAGLLTDRFILSPNHTWLITNKTDELRWLLLMVSGSLTTLMSEALHRSRRRVEESRERYAVTLKSIGDAVITTDIQGRVTLLNGEAERLTGWTNQEARGRPLGQIFQINNENTRAAIEDSVAVILRSGQREGWTNHTLLQTRDNREIFIEHSGAPIRTKGGTAIGVVLVFRDCTERKKARDALALFRTLIDRTNDSIEVVDPVTGRFLDVNENTCVNLGYTREEMLSRTVFDIAPNVTPADFRETVRQLRESGNFIVEGLHRRKNGTDLPIELNKQLVRLDREFIVVVGRDISERKQAERMLEFVAGRGWSGRREDFLAQLVEHIGQVLGVDHVFVGRLKDAQTVQTVGFYARGVMAPNVEYNRRGTPCDNVVGKMIRHYGNDLQKLFPEDRMLAEMGAHSYLGIPLADSTGRPMGLLAVLDGKPMPDSRPIEALLQIAAIRAAGELERIAAEASLRESEDLYRSFVSASPDAVTVTNADGIVEFMSPRATEVFGGREHHGGIGRDMFEWVAPEDHARARTHLRALMDGEAIHRGEYALVRTDGTRFTGETNAAVLRTADGRPKRVIFITRDITQRKQAEEMQMRLATAVEQAAEDIIVTDASGKIIYANPAFELITGFSRTEVIGQNPRILKSGRHDANYYHKMWDTLRRGEVWAGRMTNRKKDGSLFDQESTISPIRDSGGRIINYVAVRRDVTREAALESQLRQSQKLEAIGRLAGGIAHDFNNLLTVIRGNASLLLLCKQANAPEIMDGAQQIVEASERAANLTRQLLMFSRQQAIQSHPVDLNIVVGQMTKLLQRILGEDITLVTVCHAGLPTIQADSGMMEQILLNLAVNSRDAMPSGGTLTITTAIEPADSAKEGKTGSGKTGTGVKLTVTDTGTGIAPANLPHIFEPFFSTKEVGKGTGLGLATVHGIVLQHKGRITVASELGKGTTFQIYFPALAMDTARKGTAVADNNFPPGSETLLVVEDETIVRMAVCSMLQRFGYKVIQAVSGRDALKVWQKEKQTIDLLLTDIVMPDGMTGFELASQLLVEKPALKIVYTSGYSGDLADKRVNLVEGVNFLQKPYAPRKLAETLRVNLDPAPPPA